MPISGRWPGIARHATLEYLVDASNDFAGGVEALDVIMDLAQPPTAIVAPTDVLAIGMLHAAQRRGLRVPADVSISGFDDIPVVAAIRPDHRAHAHRGHGQGRRGPRHRPRRRQR